MIGRDTAQRVIEQYGINDLKIIILALLVAGTAACSDSSSDTAPSTATPATATPASSRLSTDASNLAVGSIEGYTDVLEAAISQDGKTLSLVLVLRPGVSKSRAQQLGDNFVRSTKSFGPGPAPGAAIGAGIFDFLVTVVYPDETVVAQGAKARSASSINW